MKSKLKCSRCDEEMPQFKCPKCGDTVFREVNGLYEALETGDFTELVVQCLNPKCLKGFKMGDIIKKNESK